MLRVVLVVLFVGCIFSSVYGQTDSLARKNSLVEGAWALQFQIGSNFTLSSFQGSAISVKKHLTDRSAIRFGLSGDMTISDNHSSGDAYTPFTPSYLYYNVHYNNNDMYSYWLSIGAQYQYYLLSKTDVNIYVGCGPYISYEWDKSNYYGDTLTYSIKYTSIGLGISDMIGVEWFATSSISFHAEYGGKIQYFWNENKNEMRFLNPANNTKRKSKSGNKLYFDYNGIRFGLSAYF